MISARFARGAALLLGGALFVSWGCAAAPPRARPEPVVIPNVPFLPQEEQTCGPSALAMLLRHYGARASVAELVAETATSGLAGTLITDLAAAARRRGFAAEVMPLDRAGVEERIRGGTPVILLVDLGVWVLSRPHYLLAYGLSDGGLVAHSGRDEAAVIPWATLDGQWAKMGRLALVVTRGGA